MERSILICGSIVQGVSPLELCKPSQLERLLQYSPMLFSQEEKKALEDNSE
jgi:hypothetical protein